MKNFIKIFALLLISAAVSGNIKGAPGYLPDELGSGFEKREIALGSDNEGRLIATLIRKTCPAISKKSVLYIHGFSDYFYQKEMADRFISKGFNFYALDLRKCGRSILPGQTPFTIRRISDYYREIDSAINIIRNEGTEEFFIVAHSMGGLVTSNYVAQRGKIGGLRGIILNSPFLDFNAGWFTEHISVPLVSFAANFSGGSRINNKGRSVNCQSIHKALRGEWYFDTIKKPVGNGFVTFSWIRAIHKGQNRVKSGLNIKYPVLVMYSDKSSTGAYFSEISRRSDTVLDVEDIAKYAGKIGPYTDKVVIPGGIHDLVLSQKNVRESVYSCIFRWISIAEKRPVKAVEKSRSPYHPPG
jgi:alpha-beta hydrolase superfamily lysophospholipase